MSELIDREAAIEELKSYIIDQEKAISENPDDVFQYNSGIRTAVGVIMELPAASPWHRVEEPPKEENEYLTLYCDGSCYVNTWTNNWGWRYDDEAVRYWMPIEPPKEDADGLH